MMRYQRLSPDFLPQPNSDQIYNADLLQIGSGSGSATQTQVTNNNNHDLLLKWGHKKRSRCSRTSSTEDSCSNPRRNTKIQKRAAAIVGAEKIAAVAASEMPPPTNLKACVQSNGTIHHNRTIEDKPNGNPRPEKKRSPSSSSLHNHHLNGFGSPASASMNPDPKPQPEHDSSGTGSGSMAAEKVKLEWPRIYVTLSRKEKEDDFFALKGTKLPHRPKKRAKNIDKAIQYCYPGMWLSDLTRGRYEVREKKCARKKQRLGLKGLESMDSDSE